MPQPLPPKFVSKLSLDFSSGEGYRFSSVRYSGGIQHKKLSDSSPWERSVSVSITPMTTTEINELLYFFQELKSDLVQLRLPNEPLTFPGSYHSLVGRVSYSCEDNPNLWTARFELQKERVP
jgi:hypothetical protein